MVTGCLGTEEQLIRDTHPKSAGGFWPRTNMRLWSRRCIQTCRPVHKPFEDLVPADGAAAHPAHYAYLKISEGCSNRCTFCIIPSIRGDLQSRPVASVLYEAERLVKAGVKEIMVISQDTSAYGQDIKYATSRFHKRDVEARFHNLCEELGELDAWIRLHYVYPYPHVDKTIPLMAEGKILPYLDIPFQHAAPNVLKAMRRPANQVKTADRIKHWRSICPDLAIRSTFIVGGSPAKRKMISNNCLIGWTKLKLIDSAHSSTNP